MNILLEFGVSVNNGDNFGRTALHLAPESDNHRVVELLLHNGASINAKDDAFE